MMTPGVPVAAVRSLRPERERARLEDFEMITRTRIALELLEAKWSVDLIFLMASGIRRHARLVDNAPGLSKKVLTATLRKLEADGVVERHVFAEMPVRVEYALTPLGWRLTELLMAAYEWAVAHEEEIEAARSLEQRSVVVGLPSIATYRLDPAA
jgi:DNA-binding HxlR family transcriptional regulator